MKKHKFIISFLAIMILVISTVIFSLSTYLNGKFADQSIDAMIFYLVSGTEGTSGDVFISAIQSSVLPSVFIFFIVFIPIMRIKKKNIIDIKIKNKEFSFHIFPNKFIYKFRLLYATIILIISFVTCYQILGVSNYIKSLIDYSSYIDNHYVDSRDVSITFPKEKRNLIILYLESMENSMIDKENGGGWNYNVIPELTTIAKTNLNFSNSDKVGGALSIYGTTWTVAAMVSTTSGLPLKIPVNGNEYTSSSNFLAGAYTLGDILKEEGYNQKLMFGSDADFGGRKNYYITHGNYEISDVNTAIEEGKMLDSQKVWWGYDDTHLFRWAKEEITSMASSDKPFSISLLTANTHFPDGYVESEAEQKYETQYENVYAYSSKQVDEFVKWIQQQDFYPNTTLVILGDHLSMQPDGYFEKHTYNGYTQTIYNAFINPAIEPVNSKNRIFTSLDMYPTILASIGVKINGDRLGLGTNLFSGRKTLEEELGFDYVDKELAKNSKFYNQSILQGDYFDLVKKAKKENEEIEK